MHVGSLLRTWGGHRNVSFHKFPRCERATSLSYTRHGIGFLFAKTFPSHLLNPQVRWKHRQSCFTFRICLSVVCFAAVQLSISLNPQTLLPTLLSPQSALKALGEMLKKNSRKECLQSLVES